MLYFSDTSEGATPVASSQESVASSAASSGADAQKPGLRLSHEDYRNMANLFVIYTRRQEEETDGKEENKAQFDLEETVETCLRFRT